MRRVPNREGRDQCPETRPRRHNYSDDKMEVNSRVYKHTRANKYAPWADGYAPMRPIRGRRARPDRYKDKRKGKL